MVGHTLADDTGLLHCKWLTEHRAHTVQGTHTNRVFANSTHRVTFGDTKGNTHKNVTHAHTNRAHE